MGQTVVVCPFCVLKSLIYEVFFVIINLYFVIERVVFVMCRCMKITRAFARDDIDVTE